MNNSTIFSADRTTHLKIVVISLIASIAVIIVGLAAHTADPDINSRIQTAGAPIKAGKPVAISRSDTTAVR